MPAILITIANFAPDGRSSLEQYVTGTLPLIQAAGGKVLHRLLLTDTVVGTTPARPDLMAVIRFDNPEAIRLFLQSEAYQRLVPHRNRAFAHIHSYIAEEILE